ncbi:MAG: hypothetical protein ACT4PE_13055 [Candidatus Eiseniibacteriota bacterium]
MRRALQAAALSSVSLTFALLDAARAAEPELVAIEPARSATHVTCTVQTAHLPGDRLSSSLESGLPSAIEMDLDLFDGRDRVVGTNRVFLRVAFDLWEEVFRVEGAGEPRSFADLAGLEGFLGRIPRLPVAALGPLDGAKQHRIRVALQLHPVAPKEAERLGQWVAGESGESGETADPDGREVSVSLGEVIRFFYRGARRAGAAESERFSAWFVPDALAAPEESDAANPQ